MIKSDKKLKELSLILGRKSNLLISEAIKSLREDEPFEGAIGLLVSLYNENEDRAVRKTIEEFLNDLKDHSARSEVIAEIIKPWKAGTISMLAASCWQSGLDYSEYIAEIAGIFLKGDYTTAIECMTVIEESAGKCSRDRKNEVIRMIEESPFSGVNEKSVLTLELIGILEK